MFPAAPCVLVGGGIVADLHCNLSHSSFYSGHQPEAIQCENGNTCYHSCSRLAEIKLASDDIYIFIRHGLAKHMILQNLSFLRCICMYMSPQY